MCGVNIELSTTLQYYYKLYTIITYTKPKERIEKRAHNWKTKMIE